MCFNNLNMFQTAKMNKVSIVIPFLRSKRGLLNLMNCVSSCLEQNVDALSVEVEVIVVTNFFDFELFEEISQLLSHRVFLYTAGKAGVNCARNIGVEKSSGDFIYFLDDDCILVNKNHILTAVTHFGLYPRVMGLGGSYVSPPFSPWIVRGYNAMCLFWLSTGICRKNDMKSSKCTVLLGGNSCYRRSVFSDGMRFNENIISGGDETEFQFRLKRKGNDLMYLEELAVIHSADKSWVSLMTRAWKQGRARAEFKIKNEKKFLQILYVFFEVALIEPSVLLFSLFHFPILFLSHHYNAPAFSKRVKTVGNHK